MLDAGLRAAELRHLHDDDINWRDGTLTVRQGKGSKDRQLGKAVAGLLPQLRAWRDARRRIGAAVPGPVLTTMRGRPMAARSLRDLVRRCGRRAGISWLHAHTLRHTFATELLIATKNLFLVQRAMGHSNVTTTTIYTHLTDPELARGLTTMRRRRR